MYLLDAPSREASESMSPLFAPQTGTYDDFVMARLDPDNRVGTGDEDILSRNFNWSLPLIGKAGRSGLNLGLSLTYNSLVWTKAGSYITFDADNGYPSPGFRLGFPVVYGTHYNSQTSKYGFLMIMPSGARVELRRIGSTSVYEAADSSYLQLVDNGNGTVLVRSVDGTQLSYASTSNGYRCTQIKDRNGNYLTISNHSSGRLLTVTDTLCRVFTFNYDSSNNLETITQTRGGSQYECAHFYYTNLTLQSNFTALTVVGTQSGATLPVLTKVELPDDTYFKFLYSSWGQVYKITYYAADSNTSTDSHALNYVSYNLPTTSSTAQTDCPRFTQRKNWAENWQSGNEVVTNYTAPALSTTFYFPDSSQDSGTFCQMQSPDGTYYNVYMHSSGWDEGLPVLVNTWANNDSQQLVLQKSETSTRTQDNTGVGYILNPRITETNIYDEAGNRKRVSVTYTSSSVSCGSGCSSTINLPTETKEYAADASTVLRKNQTDYNLASGYTDRRIIGLPSQQRLYDGTPALMSKVDLIYDDSGEFLVQQGSPVQHDATNYGTSFTTGRGNITKIKRWDVINTSQYTESKVGYNTTGSAIFMRSPLQSSSTQRNIIYADWFSDGQNHNTYAFPTETTILDTVGTTSNVTISNKLKYNFDSGALTRTEGPPPAGQSQGEVITFDYDSADRLYQTTNQYNSAYSYIVYPTSSNVIQTYDSVLSTSTPTVSSKLLDGAGRVRATAAEHSGSIGGYVAQIIAYDVMGRVSATSNRTEIYGSWQPAGDDAAAGWVYSYQTYDWNGRPRVTTNQDNTTKEATYGGCGCAGGEIVTLRDELNRYTKVYHDALGRVTQTDELNWNQTPYRRTTNTLNVRDQVTQVSVQDVANSTSRILTMTYDGYGRLATQHVPIQSSSTNDSFTYNADDSLAIATDALGVVSTMTYNNRGLTTGISYPNTAPTGVIETPASTFTYDAVGNRMTMTDGMGSASYQYNQISQMTSESRTFIGLSTYTVSYGYNLGGYLTTITDPWNTVIGYIRDVTGRITDVSGTDSGGDWYYASDMMYRAWGDLKSMTYGNGVPLERSFNNRQRITNYTLTSTTTSSTNPSMDIDYSYEADGRLPPGRKGSSIGNIGTQARGA